MKLKKFNTYTSNPTSNPTDNLIDNPIGTNATVDTTTSVDQPSISQPAPLSHSVPSSPEKAEDVHAEQSKPTAYKVVYMSFEEFLRQPKNYNPILCPYRDLPRYVNPAVCEFHRDMKDPECVRVKCKRANWQRRFEQRNENKRAKSRESQEHKKCKKKDQKRFATNLT